VPHQYHRSFFCERTAEYLLASRLVGLLSGRVSRVIPFYFWSTREGNTLARANLEGIICKTVAVYARRPKIEGPNQTIVSVKFNDLLFRTAHQFHLRGVPVFAGVPGVSSIWDLTQSATCYWFCLNSHGRHCGDVTMRIDLTAHSVLDTEGSSECVEGPISEDQLANRILEGNNSLDAVDVMDIISESVKRGNNLYGLELERWAFWSAGGYKPFYLLIESTGQGPTNRQVEQA